MTVVYKSRDVFIHNPKTAGESISAWMAELEYSVMYEKKYKHITFTQCRKRGIFRGKPGLVFCTVRNPWDRMHSFYRYHKKKESDVSLNWKDFEHFILRKKWKFNKMTSLLQVDWIEGCNLVLRYETLENDFEKIQDHYRNYTPLPFINTSNSLDFREFYTPEMIDVINKEFREDIKKFKYEF